MALAIRLDAVSYCYPDGQAALQDISVEIAAGTAFGVLGANGAGKSTLLLHLNGLLRGSGTVRVGEWIVAERTLPAIRAAVGLVFQNPDDQLFMPSVAEDVAFGPRNQGLAPIEVQARVQRALEIVGVGNLATRPPHHLSLGQKKRVALATVLAMDCEALLLDEPTSGLDPRGRRELIRFLHALPQTRVISTHDLDFALEVCDRVLVLEEGRCVREGPTREVFADEALLLATGLETPPTLRRNHAGNTATQGQYSP